MTTSAHYENDTITVTLLRGGDETTISFAGHHVSVEQTNDAYVMRTLGLTAPFDSDGLIHYIWAVEEGGYGGEFAVRVTAEEAAVLPRIMWEARLAAKK